MTETPWEEGTHDRIGAARRRRRRAGPGRARRGGRRWRARPARGRPEVALGSGRRRRGGRSTTVCFVSPRLLAIMLSWRLLSLSCLAVVVAAGPPRCYTMCPLGFFLTAASRLSPALLALAGEVAVGASPRVCTYSGRSLEVSDSGRGISDGVSSTRGISQLRKESTCL